jgi:hypothetical protein
MQYYVTRFTIRGNMMATKILVAAGVLAMLMAGGLYITQQNALQMAAQGFNPTVQQYASESAAVGLVIVQAILGFGALLILAGVLLGVVRMVRRRMVQRMATPQQ